MKKFLREYLDDLLLLAGCACILYGLSTWNSVLTWIVAGAMLIIFGVLVGKARI
jgi:hypothetical protein